MDKLSELIYQAKPLYKQRKRRKTIAKILFSVTIPVYLFTNLASLYMEGSDIYMSLENNHIQNQLINDDFGFSELQ